jgi:predicted metal-dependent phosphoesterase TrpH
LAEKIRVDFHTHTLHSPDSLTKVTDLLQAARQKGLDKIAVTDHNAIQGALEAYSIAPEMVIVGEEIQTQKGEILAFYVSELVPHGLTPLETIRRLRAQGAFISISHPFDPYRSGWSLADLAELVPLVDAIEVFNAHCLSNRMNEQAQQFARQHQLAGTAGSDAHWRMEIGHAALLLPPFDNAAELRQAVRNAVVQGTRSPLWLRFFSPYIRLRKLLM